MPSNERRWQDNNLARHLPAGHQPHSRSRQDPYVTAWPPSWRSEPCSHFRPRPQRQQQRLRTSKDLPSCQAGFSTPIPWVGEEDLAILAFINAR